mmetsp:Transcript_25943/g.48350  ORF Transcript_25943/g.48350 Transcript_25943/m.48350 type:complete len:316 (+) Transcript_25943:124-1071(+)
MEVESAKEGTQEAVSVHPLSIVHMSDQYTRISSGGSPLDKNAPVVGLLFGQKEGQVLQIRDADDIPVEVSDASSLQVDLHKAVFPQHKVVGWYRVSVQNEEPTAEDLKITQQMKAHHAPSESFCFCLLQVNTKEREDAMKTDDSPSSETDTLGKDLPINLYELHQVEDTSILLGISNWQLDTSEPERIAVEQVMKARPNEIDNGSPLHNPFVLETKAIQHSLTSMKDRVQVLASLLEEMQEGKTPTDPVILRQIQGLVCALGPLASMAETASEGGDEDVQMLTHLSIVAKTLNAMQSYTSKFRLMHESKEIRRGF